MQKVCCSCFACSSARCLLPVLVCLSFALLLPGNARATHPQAAAPSHRAPTLAGNCGAAADRVADTALEAMRERALALGIGGVAVVAYAEGDSVQAWSSKMMVVGRMKDLPSATDKGANLLGIAYAKAAEMADTLKDSGSQVRPPMTGEFGWTGGRILRSKTGYLIAAFSGGKSDDDVKVSQAGLDAMRATL